MSSRYGTDSGRAASGRTRKLRELLQKSDNRICADCSAPDPKWASANIGVFICLKCSGVHRSLGTHVSKVLSVTLDQWADGEINSMIEAGGNSYANAIYEAFLPEGYHKLLMQVLESPLIPLHHLAASSGISLDPKAFLLDTLLASLLSYSKTY